MMMSRKDHLYVQAAKGKSLAMFMFIYLYLNSAIFSYIGISLIYNGFIKRGVVGLLLAVMFLVLGLAYNIKYIDLKMAIKSIKESLGNEYI